MVKKGLLISSRVISSLIIFWREDHFLRSVETFSFAESSCWEEEDDDG